MQGRELDKAEKNTTEPEWMSEQQKPTPSVPLTPNYRAQCRARVQNDELGKLIEQHAQLLVDNGWEKFVHLLRQRGNLHLDLARRLKNVLPLVQNDNYSEPKLVCRQLFSNVYEDIESVYTYFQFLSQQISK